MNKVKIITDNCSSLSKKELAELGVDYVQMFVNVNDISCEAFDYPCEDPKQFYQDIAHAEKCSTSCVNTQTFVDAFEKYVKDGVDVFYVGLSGGLSCTYDNALHAAIEINEKYGEHVYVADSLSGSYGIGKMVRFAVKLANNGKSAKEIYDAIHKNNMKVLALFAPGDLKFLVKCGRLSKLAGSVGSLLKIVPIISTDEDGKLKVISKAIGRKRAMKTIESMILEQADLTTPETIYIGHTGQEEEAKELAEILKTHAPCKEIEIGWIDYTMGCACGPETLAVFVTKK